MHIEEHHNDIDILITFCLSGKPDKESLAALKSWSMGSDANRAYVRNQLEIWFSSGVSGDATTFNKDKAFDLFKQRIAKHEAQSHNTRRFPWKIVYRIAVVALILLLPLATYRQGQETVKQTFADMVVEVPMGARTKLYLPDGTLVWLNAGSKITYSQGFGVDDRILTLEGEGYFEVTRNEKNPFEVKTKDIDLTVLGTKFNFKNYPDDEEVTVSLMDGKVALRKTSSKLFLEPDEKMVLNKSTGKMTKSKTKVEYANAWANDELFFDEELMEDIAKQLMRCYDEKIEVADSLRHKRFYGSFKIVGNSIGEVLGIIASTNRMKYRHENGKYILY
ncbi:MAG: FecR family protein [Prevotellaceae bacterium]|jgi:ferric-dicitrate binding protein FerR (iron transport regulator)|nr:FecR family protein [Prevotellaceae bacterium]